MPLIQSSPNYLQAPQRAQMYNLPEYNQPVQYEQQPGLMSSLGAGLGQGLGQGLQKGLYDYMEQSALEKALGGIKPGMSPVDQLLALSKVPEAYREPASKIFSAQSEMAAEKRKQDFEREKIRLKEEEKRKTKQFLDQFEPTIYQKRLEEKSADYVMNAIEELPKAKQAERNVDRLEELAKSFSLSPKEKRAAAMFGPLAQISGGYLKTLVNPTDRAEFESTVAYIVQPAIKIFNPSGPIAEKKLAWLNSLQSVSPWDTQYTIEGKLKAAKRVAQEMQRPAEKLEKLIEKYPRGIPTTELIQLDKENNAVLEKVMKDSGVDPKMFEAVPDGTAPMYNPNTGQILSLSPDKIEEYSSKGFVPYGS